jgi:hypothetical protein
LSIEEQSLETVYQDYREKKERYALLEELKTNLSANKLQSFFEQSEWIKGIAAGNEYFGKRINEIKSGLEHLNLLSGLFDINNPDSLVRWAISLNRPLTRVEESLLLHFQTMQRTEPENPTHGNRYLPSPEALFENPQFEERTNGFWIDLGGIWEYVDYISEQRFHTTDKDAVHKYFELQNQNIEQQKKQMEDEQKNLQNLNAIILQLNNATRAIEIYQNKEELDDFKEIKPLNINDEKVQSYSNCLKRKEAVELEYQKSLHKHKEAITAQTENSSILEKLPAKIAKIKELLQNIESNKILLDSIVQQFSINQAYDYDLSFYLDSDDKIDKFQTELEIQKEDIKLIDKIKEDKVSFDKLNEELHQKEETFQFRYNELPVDENKLTPIIAHHVQQKQQEYIKANADYNAEFNTIVQNFIPNESYKFENENKDFADLMTHLLPDIFKNDKVIEEEATGKIESYLTQINDKSRDLNAKKVRKIGDLLDDVQLAVSTQADIVRKINRFFSGGEKRISGNYKLNLAHTPAKGFPVNWLSEFKNKANEQLDLFDNSIASKILKVISIEEKIKEAFKELTGNRNPDIGIADLLNPNSYMELSLEMQDANGKTNKGSTGQTYTAIALLCIARLSIVGNKRGEKDCAIRFMPIDEAEGLGSNFDMLYEIAQKYDYQIITFAINPLGRYDEQFIYILHRNPDVDANINYTPMAICSNTDIKDNLKEIIEV